MYDARIQHNSTDFDTEKQGAKALVMLSCELRTLLHKTDAYANLIPDLAESCEGVRGCVLRMFVQPCL